MQHELKLKQIKRRQDNFSRLLVGIFLAIFITCMVVVYQQPSRPHGYSAITDILIAFVIALFACWPVIFAFSALEKLVRRRWVRSYYVEEGDGVLKVRGEIPIEDFRFIKSEMLSLRPNYTMVDDARERFGCMMAAVQAIEDKQSPA